MIENQPVSDPPGDRPAREALTSRRPEPAAGRPLVRRVRDAVNATERWICGDGAVASSEVAEGLALAGRRAARLLGTERDSTAASIAASVDAAWVDHRIRRAAHGRSERHAFELVAATAQEAVDHCLVAHILASRFGQPGVCTIDPSLADSIAFARLPDTHLIDQLQATASTVRTKRVAGDARQAALEAFSEVATSTGRPVSWATCEGLKGAKFALLGVGTLGGMALRNARALRDAGLPCGAASLALLLPFPTAELSQSLAGLEFIAVLTAGHDRAAELIARRAATALGDRTAVELIDVGDRGELSLYVELARAWNVDLSEVPLQDDAARQWTTLGGTPSGSWMEELLLDTVAWLGTLGSIHVDCRREPALGVTAVAVADGPLRLDERLDLLFVAHPSMLDGVQQLRRVCEGGTVLVHVGAGDENFRLSTLTDKQRRTIVSRGLRLRWTSQMQRTRLQGAILSAEAGIGRCVGTGTDPLAALAAGPLTEGSFDIAELRAGASSVSDADLSAAPATKEDKPETALPQLLPAQPPEDPDALRQELRRFHFTGEGATQHREPLEALPLHPAVVDAITDDEVGHPDVGDRSLLEWWIDLVVNDRRRRRVAMLEEIGGLLVNLRGMLGKPMTASGSDSPNGLSSSLGYVGGGFVHAERLLDMLPRRPESALPEPERRDRIAHAVAELEHLRARLQEMPLATVLFAGDASPELPADVTAVRHHNGLRAAIGLFDGGAREAVRWARAVRVARLEVENRYEGGIHGPVLSRLSWQSLSADELLLPPAVAVLESARHLRGPALTSFSELIRSGRPVHVLVTESMTDLRSEAVEGSSGFHPGLGYLAVAHREALVLQSSLARSHHLAAGLERAAGSLEPVVVVAAAPSTELPVPPRLQLEAMLRSRATPCFLYDPAGGTSWAERFALAENPQPEGPWPRYEVGYVDAAGNHGQLSHPFTFAHAAALDPGWRPHFRVLGPGAWLDDQVEIGEYLELPERERPRSVPYLWIVDERGTLARALIHWELAFASRDRARAWRVLQELGGTHDVYAQRAAEQARLETLEQARRHTNELEANHASAMEVARKEAVRDAVARIAQRLVDPGATLESFLGAGASPTALPSAPSVEPAQPTAAEGTRAAEAAKEVPTGPSIDSFLCTSCNDCINLNPQMFAYNKDKQATIADPAAGTFAQLVKAAEICPARCIHPGTPRPGDRTATPKLLKRAAKFN